QHPGLLGGAADGARHVQFQRRALAGEAPQAPQRHLEVARAQDLLVVVVAIVAPFPDLDGRAVAGRWTADADAFRVITAVAEGRRAPGADPFAATCVAFLLLGQALAEHFHQP